MEMRCAKVASKHAVAARWRRIVLVLSVLSLMLALHVLLPSALHPAGVPVEEAEARSAGAKTTPSTDLHPSPSAQASSVVEASVASPQRLDDPEREAVLGRLRQLTDYQIRWLLRLAGQGRSLGTSRKTLLDTIGRLSNSELQNLAKFHDSIKYPSAVQQQRIEHALQALKVNVLEDVSSQKYSKILQAAQQASPVSSTIRPGALQAIISTTWRSGSTFLEELLSSHPAVYTHYEPLTHFGLQQVRGGQEAEEAQQLIHDLLTCKYEDGSEYMKTAMKIKEMISRNAPLWKVCRSADLGDALCFNTQFLSQACDLFPWVTMKIVRLRLQFLRSLLDDTNLNVKVIYLVRDPRGVMNSRYDTVRWCNTPDCNDPATVCGDMEKDLNAALELQKDFPKRVYVQRYEDMALDPTNQTKLLLDFLGLDFDPKMEQFLLQHTTQNVDKPWSTTRNSRARVTHWATKLKSDKLESVQKACAPIMHRFGYLPVASTADVTISNVLGPLLWPPPNP